LASSAIAGPPQRRFRCIHRRKQSMSSSTSATNWD
jgi:hypothetical protein